MPHAFEAPYGTPMGGTSTKGKNTKKAASTPRVKGKGSRI